MEPNKEKLVRFYHEGIIGKKESPFSWEPNPITKVSPEPLLLEPQGTSSLRQRMINLPKFGKSKIFREHPNHNHSQSLKGPAWRKRIIDPASDVFLNWNRIFLFFGFVALFLDPLFFYLPSVHDLGGSTCMATDYKLGVVVTCFRTLADLFYSLHIVVKFRTAYVSPSSRVFGKGELVTDPKMIAVRYLRSDFVVDFVAALPLPQIVIWSIIPASISYHSDHTNHSLVMIVLLQYIPRLYLIFPLSSEIIKATGVVTKTAWAGAAYNLLLYMLASHVLGASWYLLSIERYATCWKSMCMKQTEPVKCRFTYFDCESLDVEGRQQWLSGTHVFANCTAEGNDFNFGIFKNALTNKVLSSDFLQKYFYCLWWGLQNLSSYGQSLATSTFLGETCFAILIAILGLVLFAHLIGNMQTYLQSMTVRLEEWRLKRRDTEEWMSHRQLPQNLRGRVRRFVQYKWLATRGVEEESILRGLPTDLRRDIQRHLCLDLVRRVPFFAQMDDQLVDAICERLVSSLSTQGTYIVREGDPVTEMLFIIRGKLESSTTNGGRTGFFNSITLSPGEFCGEELLSWALLPKSTANMPSSTRTVRAVDEVEAFALRAEDLKFVANQFRRLHSKRLQHTFRFYSYQWRTWASCFIQAAWRRFKKRALAKSLSSAECTVVAGEFVADSGGREEEEEEEEDNKEETKPQLGGTILASRFAANTRRGAQKGKGAVELSKIRKPEEPDFTAEADEERLYHSSLL